MPTDRTLHDESAGERTVQPGRTAERVGFFTDAVFAIAMTLLVIEIPLRVQRDDRPCTSRCSLPFVWWAPWTQIPWFLTGLVGNLVGRIYRGGGWQRLRIRPS